MVKDIELEQYLSDLTDVINSTDDELKRFKLLTLRSSLLKKLVLPHDVERLEKDAISDFLVRNQNVAEAKFEQLRVHPLFRYWKAQIQSDFNDPSLITWDRLFEKGRAGPGASRSTKHTDFVGKMFCSKLSFTSYDLYKNYVLTIPPSWALAELLREDAHGFGLVKGSKLGSVAKDSSSRRVICTEPSLNMFFQLGLGEIFNSVLAKRYRIDVRKGDGETAIQQYWNRYLARIGSEDQSVSTIDLSKASDSIAYQLVFLLYPSHVVDWIDRLRSDSCEYDGEVHKLHMVSTMGNGFTFNLMTHMFAALCRAFCDYYGTEYNKHSWGVYGDDIIVPRKHFDEFVAMLNLAGFTENSDKCCHAGFFRESCGGDYFHGHDVRGVYLKELQNENHRYSAFNRLYRWCLRHDIMLPYLLKRMVRGLRLRPIPLGEQDDAGIKTPACCLLSRKSDGQGNLYYHASVPKPNRFSARRFEWNPWAIQLGYLGGFIRQHRIGVRDYDNPVRKVEKRITLNWDYSLDPEFSKTRDAMLLWSFVFDERF